MDLGVQASGIALMCDTQGTIQYVIRDELNLGDRIAPGRPLTLVVDRASFQKALNFLVTLREQKAAFDWEMNITVDGSEGDETMTLHFAGGLITGLEERRDARDVVGGAPLEESALLLIVGARTSNGVRMLYEALMRINNEQMNALRAAVKTQTDLEAKEALSWPEKERDNTLYDELSRLNNELANLQRQLAKKNVELERLNEQKNQFLGMAAHDLRNPLGVIMMYSEFLLEEASCVLDEEQNEFLSIIHASAEFMLYLVNDLLDIAKIESGELQLELQPTDLVSLVRHNVALNRVLASRKNIKLNMEAKVTADTTHPLIGVEDLPDMMLDGYKIDQVLNNLITNAIKFSEPHSQVKVSVARESDEVIIAVQDEGPGIPADEIDKLFNPFARTSVKSTAGEKSTGLGLAIVRKIVVGHGGRIWVESEVDSGSTFYVALPFSQQRGEGRDDPERK
jgi:signal transduction histidine kinase